MEWFMNDFCINEINSIINSTMDKGLQPELASVIFSLGRDAENEEEYDFALSKLMELYERDSEDIKAQVIQALAMLAVLHKDIKALNRSVVEPLILKTAATANSKNKSHKQCKLPVNITIKYTKASMAMSPKSLQIIEVIIQAVQFFILAAPSNKHNKMPYIFHLRQYQFDRLL
jgi:hypothetical protein